MNDYGLYIFFGIIIAIAVIYSLIEKVVQKINEPRERLKKELKEEQSKNYGLERSIERLQNEIEKLKNAILAKDELYEALNQKNEDSITKITSLYSDFLLTEYEISALYLESKKHPALTEAKRIRELKSETKLHIEKYKQMLYKYETLFQLFPELTEYVDDFDAIKKLEDIDSLKNLKEDYDRVQFYVSKEEYQKLSIDERNQLALDRYINTQKTKWQIGRDYELFCGLQYEKEGWDVEYIGMEKKLNDLGRDLIAKKDNVHHIIQCKYWSKEKTIHEKHITQLFGTTIAYKMNQSDDIIVIPVFITNINLSETAIQFAEKLEIQIEENVEFQEFPRIKCNVNKDEFGHESRIYHLPFDQQYDRTKINKKGEFYAYTVEEAVNHGFRRAFKYYG